MIVQKQKSIVHALRAYPAMFFGRAFWRGYVGKRRRLPRAAVFAVIAAFIPALAFAAVTTSTLVEVIGTIVALINKAIPLALGFAVLFFLWGLAKYILAAADEKKQAEGRTIMIEGIVALSVAVSVWGLVNLINATLNLESIRSEFPPLIDPDDITPPKTP